MQRRVALALAHLCAPEDQRTIFIDNNGMNNLNSHLKCSFFSSFLCSVIKFWVSSGLDLLLDLLVSVSPKHQQDGSVALYKLANKAAALSPMDAAPPSPTPQVSRKKGDLSSVYLLK